MAIQLYVDDCDALAAKMAANGSEMLMELTDMFWGERFARVRDPFGHEWGIATTLCEMRPEEIRQSAAKMFAESSE